MTRRITIGAGRCALVILALWTLTSIVLDAQAPVRQHPSAGHGGNYMYNFYFPQVPSSTPWAPDWAPDGSSIAVAMSGSIVPLKKALLVHNGEVIDEVMFDGDRTSLDFARSIQVTECGWYHLRAEGAPEERYPIDSGYAQGLTNPV